MSWQDASPQLDPRLRPFVESADGDDAAQAALVSLLADIVDPVTAKVIKGKLRVSLDPRDGANQNQDAIEVAGEVRLSILGELRRLKTPPGERVIADLGKYVAVTAYHTCYEHLRRKYPRRHSLKNKVRYLLTHDAAFTLRETADGEWLGGLAARASDIRSPRTSDEFITSRDDAQGFIARALGGKDPQGLRLDQIVRAIFDHAGVEIELDQLVSLVALLWRVQETPETKVDEERISKQYRRSPELWTNVEDTVDRRLYLQRLWTEVKQLPVRQRIALLLNLRDEHGRGAINLFPAVGVASIREIAVSLEMSAEQLAEIWNDLPLDDAALGARLDITRQQVINLRKSARARLARKTKDY